MSSRERTVQQLYPLGTLAGRPLTFAVAVLAPAYALFMAWRNESDISSQPLALASLVAICAASVTLVLASSPLRAPLTGQTAGFVVLWAAASLILGSASMWQTDTYIRDDWGSTVLGAVILALAPYRPPREIAALGVIAAILAGFVALLQAPTLVSDVPPIVFVVVTATPVLILSLGPAIFVGVLIRAIERWRRQTRIAVAALDDGDGDWIARSVQQDRVTILNRDVVPFFAGILRDDAVTASDAERAREIADDIRSVMVADADRGWLQLVIDQAVGALKLEWLAGEAVVDPSRVAQRMSLDQRSAVRAFLGALLAHPGFSSRAFSIAVSAHPGWSRVILQARIDCTETQLRSEFAPYFAVMRILFTDLAFDFVQPVLTLKFSYDD